MNQDEQGEFMQAGLGAPARALNGQFKGLLGTLTGCGACTACCLCMGIGSALASSLNGVATAGILGWFGAITVIIAAVATLCACCNIDDFCVKRMLVGFLTSAMLCQVFAIILVFATAGTSAEHACSGDKIECYQNPDTTPFLGRTCGCQGEEWCAANQGQPGLAVSCHLRSASRSRSCGALRTHRSDVKEGQALSDTDTWRGFYSLEACLNHHWDGDSGSIQNAAYSIAFQIFMCMLFLCLPTSGTACFASREPFVVMSVLPVGANHLAPPVAIPMANLAPIPGPPQGGAPLPVGWSEATDPSTGATYYYHISGETSWTFPMTEVQPAMGNPTENQGQKS